MRVLGSFIAACCHRLEELGAAARRPAIGPYCRVSGGAPAQPSPHLNFHILSILHRLRFSAAELGLAVVFFLFSLERVFVLLSVFIFGSIFFSCTDEY